MLGKREHLPLVGFNEVAPFRLTQLSALQRRLTVDESDAPLIGNEQINSHAHVTKCPLLQITIYGQNELKPRQGGPFKCFGQNFQRIKALQKTNRNSKERI